MKRELESGPGGGAAPNPQVIEFHYAGPGEAIIDIRRGAAFFPVDEPVPIDVLGEVAEFGNIEDGVGFNFAAGSERCERYEVSAYGLDREEVQRFAEGLESR